MASAPDISFRNANFPGSVLASLSYVQYAPDGYSLPVLFNENSAKITFRIYNNYALNTGIASAVNVHVTTFDNIDPGSHTFAQSVVNQSWIRIYESGYGESVGVPAIYTQYTGEDTAIGGSRGINNYIPEYGSAGSTTPQIRAGTNTNGVGFIEFQTYAELPDVVGFASYTFALTILYDWTP